ncbi:MAG: PolC-type DNA polymerase III N-terminal domain-containing protein, partial [Eubacterium ventriosum]
MNNLERKKFFDVFPALKLNDNLQAMFEEVYVTRVSSNMSLD